MNQNVVGKTNNSLFDVFKGRKCIVLKSFWYNGEGWYTLRDVETKETFESPDVFWQLVDDLKEVNNMDNTYGCDICGDRKDWDYGIVWITSSYGVCYECYKKLSREDIEKIRKEYE
jgi:hypothetical protein